MDFDNRLTWGEFLEVVQLVEDCAKVAILESENEIKYGKDYPDAPNVDSTVKQLLRSYQSSPFAVPEDKSYDEYVKNQVNWLIRDDLSQRFHSSTRSRILTPVLFYSLIMQNESNPETVRHRQVTVKKFANDNKLNCAPHWRKINPYKKYKRIYRPAEPPIFLSEIIEALSSDAKIRFYRENKYISDDAKEAAQYLQHLNGKLHYLQAICAMAQAGSFLYDILEVTQNSNYPLDTILRLYCVAQLQDVVKACRLIVDDQNTVVINGKIRFKRYNTLDIITEYTYDLLGYELEDNFDFDTKYSFPITFCYGKSSDDLKNFKNTRIKEPKIFEPLYTFLVSTFNFNFPNLIKFYLDKKKLENYITAEKTIRQHVKLQKKLMDCIIQNKQRTADLSSVLPILRSFKQRLDVLSQQSYISEYASEMEELDIKRSNAETAEMNTIAVHPKLYDTFEWQCFAYDDDDELVSPQEATIEDGIQDKWTQLEDELYDMIFELNYQRRDYAYDPKQQQYLRERIQEKLSAFKSQE